MSTTDTVTIACALIGAAGAVTASVISTRGARAAATPVSGGQMEDRLGRQFNPATPAKISRSLWWGIASLVAWIIPVLGYITTITGMAYAIRDLKTPESRRLAAVGLTLCVLAFVLALINSAYGAEQGAHGTGWWQ